MEQWTDTWIKIFDAAKFPNFRLYLQYYIICILNGGDYLYLSTFIIGIGISMTYTKQ